MKSVNLLLGVSGLLLSALTVSAVSLNISPNLQQFFSSDSSVSLSCVEDGRAADGWTVQRTSGGLTEDCTAGSGSLCVLGLSVPFGGRFWCESASGQRSEDVSIGVSDKGLILEIPALPVRTGCDVTLRCRRSSGQIVSAYFFVDGLHVGAESAAELVIRGVQRRDEGLYWCSTDTAGKSPQGSLRVRGLCCRLLVICPYCICSVLLVWICCSRNSGREPDLVLNTVGL
ncbi:uncharacterized protein PAE49_021674 [Odontesthes bonariensis]|uniref:uncharacterized protein LOC142369094 n=1 Tax=Odontesthes bonariensis TaxID=219752 RepID=UPI003F58EAC8